MYAFWDNWLLYHKVIFDGLNRLIIVTPNANSINIKIDVYSAWKEWLRIEDHTKWLPAMRTTGGDDIGGGSFSGDIYFLINDWRMIVDHSCNIDGVIFSDDFPSPFAPVLGTQIVVNKVSSLSTVIQPTVSIDGIEVPTASQIRQEIDSNSTKLQVISSKVDSVDNKIGTLPSVSQITNAVPNIAQIAGVVPTVNQIVEALPSAEDIALAVRTNLVSELNHLVTLQNGEGLDSVQATMLLEIYRLYGLDPTAPLVVTNSRRTAGVTIDQTITTGNNSTTITRVE